MADNSSDYCLSKSQNNAIEFYRFLFTCIIKVLTGTADDMETRVFDNNYYGDDEDL